MYDFFVFLRGTSFGSPNAKPRPKTWELWKWSSEDQENKCFHNGWRDGAGIDIFAPKEMNPCHFAILVPQMPNGCPGTKFRKYIFCGLDQDKRHHRLARRKGIVFRLRFYAESIFPKIHKRFTGNIFPQEMFPLST